MKNEEYFMQRALDLAISAKESGNEPFGAILVKNDEIVKEGNNKIHTNTDPTNHAELGLIRDFCQETGITDLSDYTLYTSCEPCCMCSGAMVWSKLGKMRYSASHSDLAVIAGSNIMIGSDEVFAKSPNSPEVVSQILNEEGINILKSHSWH